MGDINSNLVPDIDKAPARGILVVDDDPLMRLGLAQLILKEPGMEVVGEAEGIADALSQLRSIKADLVLVDVALKDGDGFDLARQIRANWPSLPVLIASIFEEAVYSDMAFRAGANGYVIRDESPVAFLEAIRAVLNGQTYISKKIGDRLLHGLVGTPRNHGCSVSRLTDREWQVLRLIGSGQSVREIAKSLRLSVHTIRAHREHIKGKLDLKNANALLRFAIRNLSMGMTFLFGAASTMAAFLPTDGLA